jgi:hypothetical protein
VNRIQDVLRNPRPLLAVLVLTAAVLLAGCAGKETEPFPPEDQVLAVAPFDVPRHTWDLLSGSLPPSAAVAGPQDLARLNETMTKELYKRGKVFISPSVTRECVRIVDEEPEVDRPRVGAMEYWLAVGRCVPADYLIVPQVLDFSPRKGSAYGVDQPAQVVMDIYLLDAGDGVLVDRYRFEETQRSLAQNLLDIDKFIKRGGKWIEAHELAAEGIRQALTEFGL